MKDIGYQIKTANAFSNFPKITFIMHTLHLSLQLTDSFLSVAYVVLLTDL